MHRQLVGLRFCKRLGRTQPVKISDFATQPPLIRGGCFGILLHMKTLLIVFGAKYLIIVPLLVTLYVLYRQQSRRRRELVLTAVIALPLTYVVARITGYFYFDPLPFVVGNFTPLIPHVADNGFPSDHALLATSLAALVSRFDMRWGVVLWFCAIAIGVSRVLAGVHHTIDVLGGMLIASVVVIAVHTLIARHFEKTASPE